MKRFLFITLFALSLSAVISSCGNGRHNCPAYGSIDVDNQDFELAFAE